MMRRLMTGTIVALLVLVAPRLASAQPMAGDKEVLINGSLTVLNTGGGTEEFDGFEFETVSSTSTFGQGVFNLGKFITDKTEIGGGPSIQIQSSGGDTTVGVGANAFIYRFITRPTRPTVAIFYGAEVYERDFSALKDNLFVNGVFGIKNYISDRAALEFKETLGINPTDPGGLLLLQFQIGITVLFGR